jgi:hypothetical protein
MRHFHRVFPILIFAVASSPTNLLLAQTTPVGQTPPVQAVESVPKQTRALYGYIDQHGKLVIQPQFENAKDFSEARARVLLQGKWGFIDRTGTVVIQPRFYEAEDFSEGLAPVAIGGKWGYIDKQGGTVIPLRFDRAERFAGGRAAVEVSEKWAYIDTKGKYIVQPQFVRALDFSEGLAAVCAEQQDEQALLTRRYWIGQSCAWGYLDKAGRFCIKPQFNDAQRFSQGLAAVQIGWRWGYINKAGTVVIKPQFDRVEPFAEGLACAEGGGIPNFLQMEGKIFTSWGYIDTTGKWSTRSRLLYYYEGGFSEGLAMADRVTKGRRQWGYVNHKGEFVIKPQYELAEPFSEGLAVVYQGGICLYIDTTGKTVLRLPSGGGGRFAEGLAVYSPGPAHRPAEPATDMVAFDRSLRDAQTLLEQGQYTKSVEGFMAAASEHRGNCPECALG